MNILRKITVIMKVNVVDFLIDVDKHIAKSIYFISGNEPSLIQSLKEQIIKSITAEEGVEVIKIKNLISYESGDSLFFKKKLICIEEIKGLTEKVVLDIVEKEDIFIFESINSPNNKKIKSFIKNNEKCLLLECYELERANKVKIIKMFLEKKEIVLTENVFWYLVDSLDNKYGYLIRELEKISNLNNRTLNKIEVLQSIITNSYSGSEKIFFDILKTNSFLVNCYRKKINDDVDLNNFFYSFKNFSSMITDSINEKEFKKNIPTYLFKEKEIFLKIFSKINEKNRRGLIKLLYKTEKMMRINFNKNKELGLRFLLNYKKIITS